MQCALTHLLICNSLFAYLTLLLIFFLTDLLPQLSTSRTGPYSVFRPEVIRDDHLALVFMCLFCVVVYFVTATDASLLLLLDLVSQYSSRQETD